MSTKQPIKNKVISVILSVVTFLSLLPFVPMTTASAFSEGESCTSYVGDNVTSYDGGGYYATTDEKAIIYRSNGSLSYVDVPNTYRRQYFMLQSSSGSGEVYCLEFGTEYYKGSGGYVSQSGTDSQYYNRLPFAAREGILFTLLYGYQPGKSLPISGISKGDYWMATQIIIWEYQQQLRTGPGSRQSNGHAAANLFYNQIAGRPAELAYNWILSQIASYGKIPSFASKDRDTATTHNMKWDSGAQAYTITLNDSNGAGFDLSEIGSANGITVTRNGNQYTFSTVNEINSPITCSYTKNETINGEKMLIWGNVGYQTMVSGVDDPFRFSMRFKTEPTGELVLIKDSDYDQSNKNFSFTITGNGVNETIYTNTSGNASIMLPVGTYTITENRKSEYWVVPPSQSFTVYQNQVTTVYFMNLIKKFEVELDKKDSETGYAQGDAKLHGAVYGLYLNNVLQGTVTTTDTTALSNTYYSEYGWTLGEITPSEGYLLDETVYQLPANPSTLGNVELSKLIMSLKEDVIKAKLFVIKHKDDGHTGVETPEEGAVFQVYLKSHGSHEGVPANKQATERTIITTDENGFGETPISLPYGVYTVKQIEGDPAHMMTEFDVFLNEHGRTFYVIVNNGVIESRVEVVKKDSESGNVIPISGTGFKIKNKTTGEFVTMEVFYPTPYTISEFYTDVTGKLMTPEKLKAGSYQLIEISAPSGYTLGDPVDFVVDGSDTVITVEMHNTPQKGVIEITKIGEQFATVDERDGKYTPLFAGANLDGAVFEIEAAEDIYTLDGTLRAAKGDIVDTVTTSGGIATSNPLYLGKYIVREITAPHGMVLPDNHEQEIELIYAGQNLAITSLSMSAYNDRQKVKIELLKTLEGDTRFGITGNYTSVKFGLFAAETLTAADGTTIPKDGLIEKLSVSGSGAIYFSTDLPLGKYYVKELTTDDLHEVDETEYHIEFSYGTQHEKTIVMKVNNGKAIVNELVRGDIIGLKVNEHNRPLAGARIGLFALGTTTFTDETALLTVTSEKDGFFKFEGLPKNTYVVREIEQPRGYILSEEQFNITIATQGAVIEIKLMNETAGSLRIIKTSSDGEKQGFTFVLQREATGEVIFAESYVTDAEGLIFAEGLRAGTYTVYEVENDKSSKYIIPKSQNIDVVAGRTVTIEFHNEVKSTPQTGDIRELKLWLWVMLMSGCGIIVTAIVRKTKREEI